LECARGFFVGQRQHAALLLLSILVGVGMLTLLPAAARRHDPIRMVLMQGVTTTGAVVLCLLLARPLGLREGRRVIRMPLRPLLSEVWSFGFIQLAGLVGSNLAGWWLITLLARSDKGLVQIGFFAIASQLRNLAGIAPSLLTEGSYAVMADPSLDKGDATARTPHRVMAICSFASLSVVLLLAAIGITIVPWVLPWIYGVSFKPAAMAVAIALAIAVVHMGNAPAAARLTIVSIKASGVINTVWAAFVAVAATIIFLLHGTAWLAMAIYFAAHLLSSTLVLLALKRKDHIPGGMTALFAFCATIVASCRACRCSGITSCSSYAGNDSDVIPFDRSGSWPLRFRTNLPVASINTGTARPCIREAEPCLSFYWQPQLRSRSEESSSPTTGVAMCFIPL
jgi:hypothetical protein